MRSFKVAILAAMLGLPALGGAAKADPLTGSFSFTAFTGATGFGISADMSYPFTGPIAVATFTYTGPLNFNNSAPQNSGPTGDLNSTFFASSGNAGPTYGISNFTSLQGTPPFTGEPGVANYDNLTDFLASSGSASGYSYASKYGIDLGVLAKGTVLTITHDDGISLYQNGVMIGSTVVGPTTAVTDTVELSSTTDTTLIYTRQNGSPSILDVNVPEPMSITVLGSALAALGLIRRRTHRATA